MELSKDIDVVGAKERFMNNEALFKKFLMRFPTETTYPDLQEALKKKDTDNGFKLAHTLKGVAGNLSLISINNVLNPMVERLRKGEMPDEENIQALDVAYQHIVEVIKRMEEEDIPLF